MKTTLYDLIREKRYREVREELSHLNPVDVAAILEELDEETAALVFRMIKKDEAAEVFSYMDNDQRQYILKILSKQEIKDLFDDMFADDAADFLGDLPSNVVTKLLENVEKDTRSRINQLLRYEEDSAGSIMTVEFIELYRDMTVQDALAKIRRVGIDSETVYTCYVVDRRKLIGIVTAKDLMINGSDRLIGDLMEEDFISVKTTDDREEAAKLFRKYGLIAIPVLDSEGCIVGIVTFDDAIDVLTEETTEDMNKMAAMGSSDESYLKTSAFTHAKHRIVWLLVLMLSSTITGEIIARYENTFAAVPLLVSFIPMLMDTGGNCGAQSSTLIIRGLAVDELKFSDIFRVMWKEFRVSILVSAVLAVANGARIYLMNSDMKLAFVVSAALVGTVIISKLIGCTLPILAKKIKLDPALMAAPLITTIVDTFSIIIYFNIATRMFNL